VDFSKINEMEVDELKDPFLIVNEELHDLIYQHFTGNEVMNLSKVSKQRARSMALAFHQQL